MTYPFKIEHASFPNVCITVHLEAHEYRLACTLQRQGLGAYYYRPAQTFGLFGVIFVLSSAPAVLPSRRFSRPYFFNKGTRPAPEQLAAEFSYLLTEAKEKLQRLNSRESIEVRL
jgi:hypothetical protein